ncbi:MAG: methyl-accepting chemotaxis protein, partial [Candidatus Polarisedimenticolia bacterium]
RVSEVMGEIAAASEQQTTGIGQVNVGVEQMNQMTQASAANSEESASVAEELAGQASEMHRLVEMFRLSGAAAPLRAFSSAPAAPRPSAPAPFRAASASAGRRPSPEALIPLDDDEERLKSF